MVGGSGFAPRLVSGSLRGPGYPGSSRGPREALGLAGRCSPHPRTWPEATSVFPEAGLQQPALVSCRRKESVVSKESSVLWLIFVRATTAFAVSRPDSAFAPRPLAAPRLILTHTDLLTQCLPPALLLGRGLARPRL